MVLVLGRTITTQVVLVLVPVLLPVHWQTWSSQRQMRLAAVAAAAAVVHRPSTLLCYPALANTRGVTHLPRHPTHFLPFQNILPTHFHLRNFGWMDASRTQYEACLRLGRPPLPPGIHEAGDTRDG
jgi:hypothetical protein